MLHSRRTSVCILFLLFLHSPYPSGAYRHEAIHYDFIVCFPLSDIYFRHTPGLYIYVCVCRPAWLFIFFSYF